MARNSDTILISTAHIQVPGLGVIVVESPNPNLLWDLCDKAVLGAIFEELELRAIAAVKKERETAGSNQGGGDGGSDEGQG